MTPDEWQTYCLWRDAFDAILDYRYYTIDWLDSQVNSGHAFFMCTDHAAIIYEIKTYPTGAKDVHGLIAAGELHDIRERLIPAAEERGRLLGCIGALIASRPGWARALRDSGYETHQVEVRKQL